MKKRNVAQKLVETHLVDGRMEIDEEIGLKVDQTLTQDATGTMVMLELEAMNLRRARTEISVQYIDHNIVQTDYKNADDHLFLRSACKRFGIWFSRPGNGVSHPVHMERFGKPGKLLLGSDSHTCAAGSMGMLAMGAGGLEVALAIAGEPVYLKMPRIFGVKLTGKLPDWVNAKDVILEMLRRHGVKGGFGRIVEYYGPGLKHLSAMERHVIANMGAEMGATTTVFPSDDHVQKFLRTQQREDDWQEIVADKGCEYDEHDEIDLSRLEPLIALPSSPENVVPVREVAGRPIYQAWIGSSANPSLRDFAVPALMVDGRQMHDRVSFDISPTSRQIFENLIEMKLLQKLYRSGGRIHQAGCNGCIGMGQAPASGQISLRTVPRNFPGRSGTKEDQVYLCSPETATASALTGVITDPRTLGMEYPKFREPSRTIINLEMLAPPLPEGETYELEKGPNIQALPTMEPLKESIEGPVLLKLGNDISTDEIMPAGSRVLPFRSNIPAISRFTFSQVDETYYERAVRYQETGSFVVAGENYGQGSSREHAAIAPRYLGVQAILAQSYARIHWQNLVNFGIVPLKFIHNEDWEWIEQGDVLEIENLRRVVQEGPEVEVNNKTKNRRFLTMHGMSGRQVEIVLMGGMINVYRQRHGEVGAQEGYGRQEARGY